MEHTYLKTFYEVVKAGNITKAAGILCVTQPAVSRRIQLLEKTYECELLDRSGSVLKPTSNGLILFAKIEKILDIEKELEFELGKGGSCFGFSLVTSPTFSIVHLPKIFDNLMLVGPEKKKIKISQEYLPTKIIAGLKDGRYDLAVVENCFDFPSEESLDTINLPPEDLVFAVSPAIMSGSEETVLKTLFEYPLYLHREGSCSNLLLEKNLRTSGFTKNNFKALIEIDDLRTALDNIIAGKGVTFLSSELIASTKQSQRLTTLKIPGFQHQRKRSLVFQKGYANNPCHMLFIKVIEDIFRSGSSS